MSNFKHLIGVVLLAVSFHLNASQPFFTTDIAITDDNEILLTQRGTRQVDLFSGDGKNLLRSFAMSEVPTGIVVDGNIAYVTTFETRGKLHILNLTTGEIEASILTGSGARHPVLSHDGQRVYVLNQFANTISEVDINQRRVVRTVNVLREPMAAVLSKDGSHLFVANFLPTQPSTADVVAASVSVIETRRFTRVRDIQLPNGANILRDMCITPDGRFIYVTHNLARFTVPTSQLLQGWMNTSAFSIIDVERQEFLGSVMVDEPERGAAGIWGIRSNEQYIFITHSGTHDISIINHQAMLERFLAHPDRRRLEIDLNFLHGLRRRVILEGNGPREIYLTDSKLFIPTYFADVLNIIDLSSNELMPAVDLNPNRTETIEERGYKIFHDAMLAFQNWQSCAGCHPGNARPDGLNWDLLNDGIGNPKNTRSLLFSHETPPVMISGVRPNAETAVRAGFRFIQFFEVDEETASAVDAYLRSLRPVPSPFLVDGELSPLAQRGHRVFERLSCIECHGGEFRTNMQRHRVGQDIEFEEGWDTPTLREVWRTAPYLFDGRAATIEEVFTIHRHGIEDRRVSRSDIQALGEYVKSL